MRKRSRKEKRQNKEGNRYYFSLMDFHRFQLEEKEPCPFFEYISQLVKQPAFSAPNIEHNLINNI